MEKSIFHFFQRVKKWGPAMFLTLPYKKGRAVGVRTPRSEFFADPNVIDKNSSMYVCVFDKIFNI